MLKHMKKGYWILPLILLGISNNFTLNAQQYKNSELPVDARVEDLLSRMTLEEKVAQLRIFHANQGVEATDNGELELSDNVRGRLKYGIAGIKNPGEHIAPLKAAKLNNELQKYIIEHNRLGIPALFVTESYNGVDAAGCTYFGRPISTAATFNPEMVQRIWDVVGREARFRGMHMCHSPEGDLVRDPRFGRMSETFGEDTYLTTQMVRSAVKGVQGDYTGLGNGTHIGAVTKHFAGYGQVKGGRNFASIDISPRTLIDEIFPPFKAAVEDAKSLGIMASHGDINGVASHANPYLLTEVLRDQWGFKGYVVSDANDIARLNFFMNVAETPEAAAEMGLKAGMDIDLYSDEAYILLPDMVKKDPELERYIDRSVRRVLRTKFILGLFDNPYIDLGKVSQNVRSKAALDLAKEADLESIILLKNENKTLPLNPSKQQKVALLGPLLEEGTAEQFKKVAPNYSFIADKGFQLTNEKGGAPKLQPTPDKVLEAMVKKAKQADVVVLFLGGDEFTAKEAFFNNALGDRADVDPVGRQDELLTKVKALGKPVIVVLKHRRTLSINVIAEHADAILDCWDMSEFGDESVAKILFGEVVPSGKLPVTVPRAIGQLPFHYSQKRINYKKAYLFLEEGPLYPFGYGLSYTDFVYKNLSLSATEMTDKEEIVASVDVSNNGKVAAKEVVQLYLKDLIGSVLRPDKELKGFQKITLAPGETKRVEFTITPEMLAFTGIDMKRIVEPGTIEVMIGTSSTEGLTKQFEVTKKEAGFDNEAIEQAMVRAMEWQEAHPIYALDPTDWTNGAYYVGVTQAHKATKNQYFLAALKNMGHQNDWETCYRRYHADDITISYSYLYLDELRKNIVDLEPTKAFIDEHLFEDNRWKNGSDKSGHKNILWWWCDALFMAPPVITSYAKYTGDQKYLDAMHKYYKETYDLLFDQEEQLFARDMIYQWTGSPKDLKESNGKKIFWSRGNGWVIGGLALLLEDMPKDYEHRAFYEDLFKTMAARIKDLQPADGLWRVSLLNPEAFDHGEVSGSGFFTFAMAWGVNNGLLDKTAYMPAIKKAWSQLSSCQQASGKVGWVQNIGASPEPASKDSWQNYGTGSFILAGSEILKLK